MDRAIRRFRRPLKRRVGNAFTLLELLVVLTILLMLTALLLPILTRAQIRWKQETCQQNLRHLAQAALMYARDHDDFPPPAAINVGREVVGRTWYRGNVYWPLLLLPYVSGGDRQVFRCPDAPFETPRFGPGMEWHTYAINAQVAVRIPNHLGLTPRKLSSVGRQEAAGLFVDSAGVCLLYEDDFIARPVSDLAHYGGMNSMGRSTYPSHQNGINLVFVDGHAVWIPVESYIGNAEAGRCLWGGSCAPI
ncbi:MAG: prepilin-type N-terminal cleavage/methylation domain-containing protein [Cytophagales bacterium]|nr:prepilin-type N-terminal cleavage/methylation domain-containing protein [Armatimonadota bacterium]